MSPEDGSSCTCERRGFLRCCVGAVLGLLAAVVPALGANYGHRQGHRCPACGAVVVNIWRFSGRWHWHRHGNSYWYHANH